MPATKVWDAALRREKDGEVTPRALFGSAVSRHTGAWKPASPGGDFQGDGCRGSGPRYTCCPARVTLHFTSRTSSQALRAVTGVSPAWPHPQCTPSLTGLIPTFDLNATQRPLSLSSRPFCFLLQKNGPGLQSSTFPSSRRAPGIICSCFARALHPVLLTARIDFRTSLNPPPPQ